MYLIVNSEKDLSKLKEAQNNSNILVWYYADWCGHCQMMKDEWEKLVSSKPTVNLAKVSDNFVSPEDNIVGYPTLKLYKSGKSASGKGKGDVIDFQGSRELDSFKKFLKENVKEKKQIKRSILPRKSRRHMSRRARESRRTSRSRRPRRARKTRRARGKR